MSDIFSCEAYASRMARRGIRVEDELKIAATQGAELLTTEAKAILQTEVYDIPEKTGINGKKLWVRTHTLIEEERFKARGVNIIRRNPTPWSIYRFRYGGPGGQRLRPPQQISHWYQTAILRNAQRVFKLRVQAVERGLMKP